MDTRTDLTPCTRANHSPLSITARLLTHIMKTSGRDGLRGTATPVQSQSRQIVSVARGFVRLHVSECHHDSSTRGRKRTDGDGDGGARKVASAKEGGTKVLPGIASLAVDTSAVGKRESGCRD